VHDPLNFIVAMYSGGYRGRVLWEYAPSRKRRAPLVVLFIFLILACFALFQLVKPPAPARVKQTVSSSWVVPGNVKMPWPSSADVYIDLQGVGPVGGVGVNNVRPTASTAKIMTAYVILHDHPLSPGKSGPTITVSQRDVTLEVAEAKQLQYVQYFPPGLQLTEKQLLYGLLMQSWNNAADILARWDSGSRAAFVQKMNNMTTKLGLDSMHFADDDGVSSHTVSSPYDLVKLAEICLKDPVFAKIVSTVQTTFPTVGVIYNLNQLVGHDGVIGVKTGWTPQAGGVLVFAARHTIDGRQVTLVGAEMGITSASSDFDATFSAATSLINTTFANLKMHTFLPSGTVVAYAKEMGAKPVPLVIHDTISLLSTPGMRYQVKLTLKKLEPPLVKGTLVGYFIVSNPDVSYKYPVYLGYNLPTPPWYVQLFTLP